MTGAPVVGLVRRWAEDWLEAADPAVCDDLLAEDYSLAISGTVLGGPDGGGRDGYVRATVDGLLRPFPGATLAVHELVATDDAAGGLMTWRGTTPDGVPASWRVVAMFRAGDGRLTVSHCEEDYLARRRQLKDGTADDVPPVEDDPWSTPAVAPDPSAEDVVRAWLAAGDLTAAALDDGRPGEDPRLDDVAVEVLELFSAGSRVVFHAVLRGRYAGGLAGVPAAPAGAPPVGLGIAGLVTVAGGAVARGHVVRDRLGLRRTVIQNAKESV